VTTGDLTTGRMGTGRGDGIDNVTDLEAWG